MVPLWCLYGASMVPPWCLYVGFLGVGRRASSNLNYATQLGLGRGALVDLWCLHGASRVLLGCL
jgi:hypothetical protein